MCVWGVCSLSNRSTSKSLVGSLTELKPQVGMWPSSGGFPDSTRRNVLFPEPSSPSTSTSRCSNSSSAGSSSSSSSGCGHRSGCGRHGAGPFPREDRRHQSTHPRPPPVNWQEGKASCRGTSAAFGVLNPKPRSSGFSRVTSVKSLPLAKPQPPQTESPYVPGSPGTPKRINSHPRPAPGKGAVASPDTPWAAGCAHCAGAGERGLDRARARLSSGAAPSGLRRPRGGPGPEATQGGAAHPPKCPPITRLWDSRRPGYHCAPFRQGLRRRAPT